MAGVSGLTSLSTRKYQGAHVKYHMFAAVHMVLSIFGSSIACAQEGSAAISQQPTAESIRGQLASDGGGVVIRCMYKMERYGGLRGDSYDDEFRNYELALAEGRKCIEADVDATPAGWLVHLWMAFFLKETGQVAESNKHLEAAFKLDEGKIIERLNLLARYGFSKR